jgi:hypothetical protein
VSVFGRNICEFMYEQQTVTSVCIGALRGIHSVSPLWLTL